MCVICAMYINSISVRVILLTSLYLVVFIYLYFCLFYVVMQSLHTLMSAQCSHFIQCCLICLVEPLTGFVFLSCCLIINDDLKSHQLKPLVKSWKLILFCLFVLLKRLTLFKLAYSFNALPSFYCFKHSLEVSAVTTELKAQTHVAPDSSRRYFMT